MYRRCCQILVFMLSLCLLFENSVAAVDLAQWQTNQQQEQKQAQPEQAGLHHDHATQPQLNAEDHGCDCDCDCQSDCMSTCHPGFTAASVPLLAANNRIYRRHPRVPPPHHRGTRLLRPPITA